MTRRTLFAFFLFCCLPLPVSGSPVWPIVIQEPRLLAPDFGLLQACHKPLTGAYSAHYTGVLTDGTTAHAKLTFFDNQVTGMLVYPQSSRPLNLSGTLSDDRKLTITVSSNDWSVSHVNDTPQTVAQMVGTLSGDNNDTFAGIWIPAIPFVFTRSAVYGTFTSSEGFPISNGSDSSLPASIASVEYPRFLAPGYDALNAALARRAQRDWDDVQAAGNRMAADTGSAAGRRRDLRTRRTFIYHADHRLAGMLTLEYSETGNPVRSGRTWLTENYQFTDGQARRVNLPDLFRNGAPWMARLSSLCRAELARQGADAIPPMLTASELQAFLVSPAGLSIWFNSGTIADESTGDYSLVIPWLELADLIDRDGPAAAFLAAGMHAVPTP